MVPFRRLPFVAVLLLAAPLFAQQSVAELVAAGREHCGKREWAAAIALLDRALAQAPDDLEALRWRGHAFTGSEQHERARADLNRALELGADDAWVHYAHAMALHHLGQLEAAVRGYSAALAIDGTFFKANEWRGFTLSRLGRHREALADLDAALRVDGGNAWLSLIRGKARAALLDLEGAEHDLWRAADGDPQNGDAAAQLGYLLVATGQRVPGEAQLERAMGLDAAGQAEAALWRFHLRMAAGDEAAAQKLLAPWPVGEVAKEVTVPWPRVVVQFLRGALTSEQLVAAAAATPVAERAANRCAAWLHIGLVARRSGRDDDALRAFARAVATDVRDQWEWTWARQALREVVGEV